MVHSSNMGITSMNTLNTFGSAKIGSSKLDTTVTKDIYKTVSKARDLYRETKDSHDKRIVAMEDSINRRYSGNGKHNREVSAMQEIGFIKQTDNRLYLQLA